MWATRTARSRDEDTTLTARGITLTASHTNVTEDKRCMIRGCQKKSAPVFVRERLTFYCLACYFFTMLINTASFTFTGYSLRIFSFHCFSR